MKAIVIHKARDIRVEDRGIDTVGPEQVAVSIERGGICGSDLHYYLHGGFGAIRLQEPMVLGHEVSGIVREIGPNVSDLKIGDKVAVNPSLPCGRCSYCQVGHQNHCLDMRFFGSAMRMPHVQGAFQQVLVVKAGQCHRVADSVSLEEAAFAEPFAVTLHAIVRAGSLAGKKVLVTGCGPIGALTIVAARVHGAQEIVATDVSDFTLGLAAQMGADRCVKVGGSTDNLAEFMVSKGTFDVMFEASGNQTAFRGGLECLKPRGTLVQVGLGGEMQVPQNTIVAKEIEIKGSFRFHGEFALAVDLINRRRVDLKPLLSDVIALDDAVRAFDLAADRSRAMKVQIAF